MNKISTSPFSLSEAIDMLGRTPRILRVWCDELPDAWMDQTEGGDTFSPRDVLGHLIHGEKTDWMPRLRQVLGGMGDQPFEPFDRFAMRASDERPPVSILLEEFERLREDNLSELRACKLSADDMMRTGIHPAIGTVTIEQLLATWTAHDLAHLAQVARTMAKRYAKAVGPWRAHLRVMDRT